MDLIRSDYNEVNWLVESSLKCLELYNWFFEFVFMICLSKAQ